MENPVSGETIDPSRGKKPAKAVVTIAAPSAETRERITKLLLEFAAHAFNLLPEHFQKVFGNNSVRTRPINI